MLVLESVTYRYAAATEPALIEVDLAVGPGEVVGLCGPSEAGKSTLALVASGLAPRAIRGRLEGRLLIDGVDVAGWPMHELVAHVGVVFQDPMTQLSGVCATVYEEVAFGPMNLGLPRDDVVARTDEAIATLGIGHLGERDPTRLSGGQMQLVAIAGLLALRPRHLVLDEPTAELDPAGAALVGEALRGLAVAGTPILIAEQRTDLLARLCTRVAVLDRGRIAFAGPAGDVLSDERLVALGVDAPSSVRLRRRLATAALLDQRVEAGLDALSAGPTG